jgi:16S rRNA (guanine527-N7)-methyltransferase
VTTPVEEILDAAVAEGFLTPLAAAEGPAHSAGFLRFGGLGDPGVAPGPDVASGIPVDLDAETIAVDLGTGGGVPGLVLATLTSNRWVLVDRGDRRCTFLRWAVRELGIADRVEVHAMDAVSVARGDLRGRAGLVTARSFAAPGPTAECAAPLLALDGVLVVSEPPGGDGGSWNRWDPEALDQLGMVDLGGWRHGGAGYRVMRSTGTCPSRFPRRFKRQLAGPLF